MIYKYLTYHKRLQYLPKSSYFPNLFNISSLIVYTLLQNFSIIIFFGGWRSVNHGNYLNPFLTNRQKEHENEEKLRDK